MRVLTIGECMAELGPGNTPSDFRLGFAGDTFNTAWYLAQCAPDVDVFFLTVIGEDPISQKMKKFVRSSGINDRFLQTLPDKTIGLYLISLDQGERSFSYWRSQSAARMLANDAAYLRQAMTTADLIYFSGITLAILDEQGCATLLFALREARALGKIIAFDPNLRPKLWESTDMMTKTIMEGSAVSDIVLPSFEDEANWFKDATPQATVARYTKAGAGTVIVKNGIEPVYFAEGAIRGEVGVNPVINTVDTTAAGDSFNAGIFASHAAGNSLADSITYACHLSRAVIQQKGALVPIIVDRLPPLRSPQLPNKE